MEPVTNPRAPVRPKGEKKKKSVWQVAYEQRYLYLMSLPFVLWVFVFHYIPVWGWTMAFQDFRPGLSFFEQEWVGWKHFIELFSDERFYRVLRNTLAMSIMGLIANFTFPIFFAIMLNEIRQQVFKRTVQTISYLPHFVSWVVAAGIVTSMLSIDGIVNALLVKFHIFDEPVQFMARETWFWWIVTFSDLWKEFGWNSIIFLAAMAGINPQLYEAAKVDGAGRFRQIWHITLPGIRPTFIILLILSIGHLISIGFEKQFLLGNQIVIDYSEVLELYALNYGIGLSRFSYGTAIGIFNSLVSITLLFAANGFSNGTPRKVSCRRGELHMGKQRAAFIRRRSDLVFDAFNTVFMLGVVTVTLYPFLHVLAVSLNESTDTVRGGITIWPREFTLANYEAIFQYGNLLTGFKNSVLRTFIGTVLGVLCASMLAYTLSRRDFQARRFVSVFLALTMYFSGGLIPVYMLIRDLGLINSFWVYIFPTLINAFNVFVIRSYMDGLPYTLQESAKIDGANDFMIFWRIILPLCKPVLATIALFIAVGQWNMWFDTYLYNGSEERLTTLQYELMKVLQSTTTTTQQEYRGQNMSDMMATVSPESVKMAITVVVTVPILLVYPFLQRYFMKGMIIGAVKH